MDLFDSGVSGLQAENGGGSLWRHSSSHAMVLQALKEMEGMKRGSQETARKECLETLEEVARLEKEVNNFSHLIDARVLNFSKKHFNNNNSSSNQNNNNNSSSSNNNNNSNNNILGFLPPATQDCIQGLARSWRWIGDVMNCASIHLLHASEYHQLVHEVNEIEGCLEEDLERIVNSLSDQHVNSSSNNNNNDNNNSNSNSYKENSNRNHYSNNYSNHNSNDHNSNRGNESDIVSSIKAVTLALKQWELRLTGVAERATRSHPVPLRVEKVQEALPAVVMVDYEDGKTTLGKNEQVVLLDNSQSESWKVKNGRGQEVQLPPVILRIPAADNRTMEVIDRLRLKLLSAWTTTLKKGGMKVLCFGLELLQTDYQPVQIRALKGMQAPSKNNLLEILAEVERVLQEHWSQHQAFVGIQERVSSLRMILEEMEEEEEEGRRDEMKRLCGEVVEQILQLGRVGEVYKELTSSWKSFKVSVEVSKQYQLLLLPQQWQQLKLVPREELAKHWQHRLSLSDTQSSVLNCSTFELAGEEYEDTISFQEPTTHSASITIVPTPPLQHSSQLIKLTSQDKQTQIRVAVPLQQSTNNTSTFRASSDGVEETSSTFTSDSSIVIKPTFPTLRFTVDLNGHQQDPRESSIESGFSESRTVESTRSVYDSTRGINDSSLTPRDSSSTVDESAKDAVDFLFNQMTHQTSQQHSLSALQNTQELTEEAFLQASQTEYEGTALGVSTETKTAETEQLTSAEVEEDRTYVIGGVLDTAKDCMVSLQEAMERGLILPEQGIYVDSLSKQKEAISTAMNRGWIKVVRSSVRRGQEKFSSVGIITVKTVKETLRPYVVKSVTNTMNGEVLEPRKAAEAGILDEADGWVLDSKKKQKMLITEAADLGLLKLQYTAEAVPPEVVVKSYAVRAVVDRAAKKTITFHEAVAKGIIDKETGAFKDTVTNEIMYVGDAIMRGFLKARQMADVSGMNIDPSNKMIVEKTQKIRSKLLNPLKVISAFKGALKRPGSAGAK